MLKHVHTKNCKKDCSKAGFSTVRKSASGHDAFLGGEVSKAELPGHILNFMKPLKQAGSAIGGGLGSIGNKMGTGLGSAGMKMGRAGTFNSRLGGAAGSLKAPLGGAQQKIGAGLNRAGTFAANNPKTAGGLAVGGTAAGVAGVSTQRKKF